jgi:hypothetical protein
MGRASLEGAVCCERRGQGALIAVVVTALIGGLVIGPATQPYGGGGGHWAGGPRSALCAWR